MNRRVGVSRDSVHCYSTKQSKASPGCLFVLCTTGKDLPKIKKKVLLNLLVGVTRIILAVINIPIKDQGKVENRKKHRVSLEENKQTNVKGEAAVKKDVLCIAGGKKEKRNRRRHALRICSAFPSVSAQVG